MSLQSEAHEDLLEIIGDDGVDVVVTDPDGNFETFKSLNNDIHLTIDPSTQEMVSGRQSTVSLDISSLMTAGFEKIRGVPDKNARPWIVETTDINGVPGKFKVQESNPDHGHGLMVLFLEIYK